MVAKEFANAFVIAREKLLFEFIYVVDMIVIYWL